MRYPPQPKRQLTRGTKSHLENELFALCPFEPDERLFWMMMPCPRGRNATAKEHLSASLPRLKSSHQVHIAMRHNLGRGLGFNKNACSVAHLSHSLSVTKDCLKCHHERGPLGAVEQFRSLMIRASMRHRGHVPLPLELH